MAKEKEVKKEVKVLSTLSVYLTNGAHLDIPVDSGKDPRDFAAFVANQGVWGAVKRARPAARAVYLSAEQFTSYFLEALRGRLGVSDVCLCISRNPNPTSMRFSTGTRLGHRRRSPNTAPRAGTITKAISGVT